MIGFFTRETCTKRLIAAAKATGLVTDGESIWAPDAPDDKWLIEPDLLDLLAVIYHNDGGHVTNGGELYKQDWSGEELLTKGTVTLEQYQAMVARDEEPRVRWITGSKQTVTPSDWGSEVGK